MFTFKNKIIYIFSAERWGNMKLSKHHYAIELSLKGNVIYFFESAVKNLKKPVKVNKVGKNIYVVSYPFIGRGRNVLPKFMYNYLLKLEVNKIINGTGVYPDVVWSFDIQRVNRLPFFKRAIKIFHPVDFFAHELFPQKGFFDIAFSPISRQVADLKKIGYKIFFINHGLSAQFIPFAINHLQKIVQDKKHDNFNNNLKVGYIGNLIMGIPDLSTMRKVVEQNKDISFHFWGQYERNNSTLAFYDVPEVFEFIDFLKNQSHVKLYGPVDTPELAYKIQEMDGFWICWKTNEDTIWNKYTNPHKIIEYLSTGKPVIAHHIEQYKSNNLLYSLKDGNNNEYPEFFRQVIKSVRYGEDKSIEIERINYALNNTYEQQIEIIEKIITDNLN